MRTWLAVLLGAGLVVAVVVFAVVRSAGDGDAAPSFEVGEDVTVRGEVVENTIDPCRFPDATPCVEDLGFALRLDVGDRLVSVWYDLGMGEPCPNEEASEQAGATRVGTTVEVHGEVESAGDRVSLTTCTSPEHYVRQVE